jgi:hypothetical protein
MRFPVDRTPRSKHPSNPPWLLVSADTLSLLTTNLPTTKPGNWTLTAYAEVPPFVSNVSFERDVFFGGLKFDLGGSFGTPQPGPSEIVKVANIFDITLSFLATPSHYCLVVIKDHPNGAPVLVNGWPPLDGSANGAG